MSQTHSADGPESSSRVTNVEQEAPPWLNLPDLDDSDPVLQKTAILPFIPPDAFGDDYAASPIKRQSLDPRRTPPDRDHKWYDHSLHRILLFDKPFEIPAGVLDWAIFGSPVPQYVFLVERDPGWKPIRASRWMYPTMEPQRADIGKTLVDVCASRLPTLTPSDERGGVTSRDFETRRSHNIPSNVLVVHGVKPAMRSGRFYRTVSGLLSDTPPVSIALVEDRFYINFHSTTHGRKAFGALKKMQYLLPNCDIQLVFTPYDEFETAFLFSTDIWVFDTDADAYSRPITDATPVSSESSHPSLGNDGLHAQLLEMEGTDGPLQASPFQGSIDNHGQTAEWRPGDDDSHPIVDASSTGNDSSKSSPGNDELHAQLLEMEGTDGPLQAPSFQGSIGQAPEWRPGDDDSRPIVNASSVDNDSSHCSLGNDELHVWLLKMEGTNDPHQAPSSQGSADGRGQAPKQWPREDTPLSHGSLNRTTPSEKMDVIESPKVVESPVPKEIVAQRVNVACQTEVCETPVPQRREKACQTEHVPSLPAEVRGVACQTDFLEPPLPEVQLRHVNVTCQTDELQAAIGTSIAHVPAPETVESPPLVNVLDVRHSASGVTSQFPLNSQSSTGATNLTMLEAAVGASLRLMMDSMAVQLAQEFHRSVEDMQDVVFAACRSVGRLTPGTLGMCADQVANATPSATATIPPPVFTTPAACDMKSEVVRGLRWGLQDATGEDIPLQWVHYERLIELKHGWYIVGWPANTPIQNPSTLSDGGSRVILTLWRGLRFGDCYWARVPDARMAELKARYEGFMSADADAGLSMDFENNTQRPTMRGAKRTRDGGDEQCPAKSKKKSSPDSARDGCRNSSDTPVVRGTCASSWSDR
ncbi:hypothetical protein B0H11DRAFT_1917526 [Mycena galericulata]|nr:hypothetical protein B0H11DRAFT_1917526 [Mycena galericulata]